MHIISKKGYLAMPNFTNIFRKVALVLTLLLISSGPALAAISLFENKPVSEKDRQQTIERIQQVQEKLKLLQEKLKAIERRKESKGTDKAEPSTLTTTAPENWQAIDVAAYNPGDYGVYTYLLFVGDSEDPAAVGALEDLILTIETLPATEVPASFGNRFLVPVEVPQSNVDLGRQPYDYKLNAAYLQRFGLDLPGNGPVLISTVLPVDPYGTTKAPAFLAVTFGQQTPVRTQALLERWHQYEMPGTTSEDHPLAGLFLSLLNEAGPTRVEHANQRLLIDFSRK